MAQMAPALTEASASPGSSRKNSVDLFCPSEKRKEEGTGLGVDLKLLSQNGLVRLLGEANSITDITKTSLSPNKNTPIKRKEELKEKSEMPNGHCDDITGKHCSDTVSVSDSEEEKRKQQAVDLSRKTCASTTARSSTGTCSTECDDETRNRVSQHPVADLELPQALISKRSARAIHRQTRLENQARKLDKRLRRLQARQIDVHVRQQVIGFFGHQEETSQSPADLANKEGPKSAIDVVFERSSSTESRTGRSVNPETNNTTTILSSLTNQVKGANYITTFESDGRGRRREEHIDLGKKDISKISNDHIEMADNVLGRLSSQVEHLENIGDSDATDVSSGEESESEEAKRPKLRSKRSRFLRKQYRLEEGEVASRWSWLQSQIINVERRIRRFDELYRGLRTSKGSVKLQESVNVVKPAVKSVRDNQVNSLGSASGVNTMTNTMTTNSVMAKGQGDFKLKEVLGECENHLKNGVRKSLLGDATDEGDVPVKRFCTSLPKTEPAANSVCNPPLGDEFHGHSARTRGTYTFRKRPLVHLSRFQWHVKAGTVPCTCSMPANPCMLCSKTCRTLPVVDERQSLPEKVALLDWCFHPTLSFFTDIPLQLHFASLLKKGEFESRTKPSLLRSTIQNVEKKKPPVASKTSRSQLAKGAAATILSSAKLRNQKYERKRVYSSVPNTPKNRLKSSDSRVCHTDVPRKKRAAAISAAAQLQKRARSLSLPTVVTPSSTPTPSSPVPPWSQSMPPSSLGSLLRKKRNSNAFDINNIVIPYSMASTTRVEKLQYKEIPTPSWRMLEVEPGHELENMDGEPEDLTEETFRARHAVCEVHERKRFLGLVKKKRKRTQRQSSELSTPDPSSPLAVAPDLHSTTPPGTPGPTLTITPMITTSVPSALSPVEKIHQSLSESQSLLRRSSSMEWVDRTADVESWAVVPPWPGREFPLSESEVQSLKLPTPLPTPVSSMPASPAASSPGSPMCSPLASPTSEQGNEKNEWTVKLVTTDQSPSPSGETGQPRKGIVLKLAKR